jgi:signal transduction histidine kinase
MLPVFPHKRLPDPGGSMSSIAWLFSKPQATTSRAQELFDLQLDSHYRKVDRMFAILMVFQWIAGIAAAVWLAPFTWAGREGSLHIHLWASLILGGTVAAFPILMTYLAPGKPITRHSIAIGQMLTSGLLVHLTGGRIETHFHYFGSLAFLAFYRDWRVLVTATLVVSLDHFLRGVFWPLSIFGISEPSQWRWLEHAGWVVFEDIFLFIAIRQTLDESLGLAERQARVETINETIEKTVQERTLELETTHRELEAMSRSAGMAQIATNVLHNVGNVLNSVNVSTTLLTENTKKSKVSSFPKIAALLKENEANLAAFMSTDPRGKQLAPYITQLSDHLQVEQAATLAELESLRKNIDHIKMIVGMQQTYAKGTQVKERLNPVELIEDSVRMNSGNLTRQNIQIIRDFHPTGPVDADKHKTLQILVNLVRNAAQACMESSNTEKRITLRITKIDGRIHFAITDNGIGIAPENIDRIFNQGFTTKKDGHGFGLHSAANAAREMAGSLGAHSAGPNTGATFTLQLPVSDSASSTTATAPTPAAAK